LKNTSYQTSENAPCPTRRQFLKNSGMLVGYNTVFSNLLFTGLSTGIGGSVAYAQQLPANIKIMDAYEYQVFSHLIDIALPVTGTLLPNPHKINTLQTLDTALLGGIEAHILTGLKAGIRLFDTGPKSTYQNQHFTQLNQQQAVEFCDTWANSNSPQERGIVMGLKKLVGLAYWSNPTTWPMLGYAGPISKRKGIPSLGNAPLPI